MTMQLCTHTPFLDRVVGDGLNNQGVYGILGPTGVGKTHLAMMITVNSATMGDPFSEPMPSSKRWVLFDVESPGQTSWIRAMSHAAKIKRDSFTTGLRDNIVGRPTWYENERDDIPTVNCEKVSERTRSDVVAQHLNSVFCLCSRDHLIAETEKYHNSAASGGFDDTRSSINLTSWIDKLLCGNSKDGQLGGIVIDSVSHLCQLAESSKKQKSWLEQFVGVECRKWSKQFRCPVWVVNQLSGEACSYSTTTVQLPRDSARHKDFINDVDACLVLGTRCPNSDVFSIYSCRPREDKTLIPVPVEFDPNFATIVEARGLKRDRETQLWIQDDITFDIDVATEQYIESLNERFKIA